jgi:hypothetical protein
MQRIALTSAIVVVILAFIEAFLSYFHVEAFIKSNNPGYAFLLCLALIIAGIIKGVLPNKQE